MMKRWISVLLVVLLTAFCLTGCDDDFETEGSGFEEQEAVEDALEEDDGEPVEDEADGGDPDEEEDRSAAASQGESWSIYIYLCGTDLETEYGMATSNIDELMSVSDPHPDVNVYIQTGGTEQWQNGIVDPSVMQRYHVDAANQSLTLLDEGELTSMGDESTLADFLSWATEHNTADRMGILFWNHGGGAFDGLENDEMFGNALSIGNLKSAFDAINPGGEPFLEFVGFDTCLMANIEIVSIFGSHARYLIASEEVEPGGGWDYDTWYGYLCENPGATGAELGVVVCDSYYAKCAEGGDEGMATLSVVDLSMADEVINGFVAVAMSMAYGTWDDPTTGAEIIRGVQSTERYGGDTEGEGYTNLVDVGHMVSNISGQLIDGGESFLSALDAAVIYKVNGPYRAYSTGLSIFYPMVFDKNDDDSIQGLYDYAATFGIEDYSAYLCSLWGIPYDYEVTYGDDGDDAALPGGSHRAGAQAGGQLTAVSAATGGDADARRIGGAIGADGALEVRISREPEIDDDGMYNMTIDPDTLDNVKEVMFSLYVDLGDDIFCYLGSDNDLLVDWESGYVEDNFRGVWPSIGGQYVTFDLVQSADEYIIYSIPILLNGEATNLRAIWEWDDPDSEDNYDGKFIIWGAWDGIDKETGMASRDIKKLKDGDVIIPLLYAFHSDDPDEIVQVEGDPITVQGELALVEEELEPGEYWYCFAVEDLMGKLTQTDFAIITIDESGEMVIE